MIINKNINSIFTTIQNGVNSIYESVGQPWIYNTVIPEGVLKWIEYERDLESVEVYTQHTFVLYDTRIFIIKSSLKSSCKTIKAFIDDSKALIFVIPEKINEESTEINMDIIMGIYTNIFVNIVYSHVNSIRLINNIATIFTMFTIMPFFNDANYSDFILGTPLTEELLKEITKYTITELYDNLLILKFI